MLYEKRSYRSYSGTEGLVSFSVSMEETDLFISASNNLADQAKDAVQKVRLTIKNHLKKNRDFRNSLVPLPFDPLAPDIIKKMLRAAAAAGVGPMAAVAGAVAEFTGTELLKYSAEVIIENGGDIFLKTDRAITVGIFAGESPLSEHIGIKILSADKPCSICTSSGRVGPSLSFGSADAVTIKSASACLADAAATAIGNMINKSSDIQKGIDAAKNISLVSGALIIKDEHLGVWGDMELVSL